MMGNGTVSRTGQMVDNLLRKTSYTYPRIVHGDVVAALGRFPSMRAGVGTCRGHAIAVQEKCLIYLRGNLQISHKGRTFSVPVSLWVLKNYPVDEPIVKIELTSCMIIPSGYIGVEANGDISIPMFYDWKQDNRSIRGLLLGLASEFSKECPVFSLDYDVSSSGDNASRKLQKISQSIRILHRLHPGFYQEKEVIIQHLIDVFNNYPNLYPADGAYYAGDLGKSMNLMHLKGNISDGSGKQTPITVWIPQFYPIECPLAYVTSSLGASLVPNENVDADGRVHFQYTQQWNKDKTIIGILEVMSVEFSAQSPICISDVIPEIPDLPATTATPNPDATLCKICMDAPMDVVFFLCLHLVTCHDCAEKINECPVCREPICRKVRIYPV